MVRLLLSCLSAASLQTDHLCCHRHYTGWLPEGGASPFFNDFFNEDPSCIVGEAPRTTSFGLARLSNICLSETYEYRNLQSFETAWQTINQHYYDPNFGGTDWKSIHKDYKSRVSAAKNEEESILLINQMLFELNVSHLLAVYPDDIKKYMPIVCAEGGIGIDVRLLDGKAVITMVRDGTPAAKEGLRAGYVIDQIDGKPVEEIVQEGEALLIPPFNPRNRQNNLSSYLSGHIYGPKKTKVRIGFRDKNGKLKQAEILRQSRGRGRVAMEAMPPYYIEFESKRLEQNIGYFRFNHWGAPVDTMFTEALAAMHDVHGIIIDLRGNPGGFLSVVHTITEHLLAEKELISTWKFRNERVDYIFGGAPDAYQGQIVVLIDVRSTSSSEYFAGSLQSLNRAVIIGEHSPGYLLIANWKKLMNLPAASCRVSGVTRTA